MFENRVEIQKLQNKFSCLSKLAVREYMTDGHPQTDISLPNEACEALAGVLPTRIFGEYIADFTGGLSEDQIMIDVEARGIRLILQAIRAEGELVGVWALSCMILGEYPAKEEEIPWMLSEEEMYRALDFLRVYSWKMADYASDYQSAQAENLRSHFSEKEMSAAVKRMGAETEIVQLLESEEPVETILRKILKITGDFLQVCSEQVIKINGDEMDILTEWLAPGVLSYFDRTQKLKRLNIFRSDQVVVVSDRSSVGEEDRLYLQNANIRSTVIVPVIINEQVGMYVCFNVCDRSRHWHVDDLKFMGDAVKVIQSVLVRKIQKNSLVSSYAALEAILDNSGSAVCVMDIHHKSLLFANRIARYLFKHELQEGMLHGLLKEAGISDSEKGNGEYFHTASGKWYDIYGTPINWVDGKRVFLYIFYDITNQKIYQKKIEQQAYTDFLTGLYNRLCCERDLSARIDDTRNLGTHGVLLYLDLDDFKHINDALGHQYGDILLKAISHSFQRIPEICDTCYRMGGDEFVIIIPPKYFSERERIIDNIKNIFNQPYYLKEGEYYCTMSMGVVIFPDEGDSRQELIRKADVAMYEAKKGGKNRVVTYEEGIESISDIRLDMEKNMRLATLNNLSEFEIYYQPIVRKNRETREWECCGAEALIRWNSKQMGVISPAAFIPLAEYLGLIVPIGQYVLKEACVECKRWNDSGYPNFKVNVNLSVVQLLQGDIIEVIQRTLDETSINPANLTLEVTESLAINDMNRMKDVLGRIVALGVRIALDDFGTGYSSLNHIREIPLDVIKIDQNFVRDLEKDNYQKAFIAAIVELAKALKVNVCVEGIETKEQLDILTQYDVEMIQGYYFDRPMSVEEYREKYILPNKEIQRGEQKEIMTENEKIVEEKEVVSKNFIEQIIDKDLAEGVYETVHTRFPPEPNGYLHIGHAKSILLNYGIAQEYNGKFNMRFDDTNPTKEKTEFVDSILKDIKWLGADWEDRLFFASNYFDQMYEAAVKLIKKGKAYVSDLTAEQMKEYRGTLTEPGKEDPSANRSIEENLKLFEEMKNGVYKDGEKVLRARIDIHSPNMNMRDPIIYRVAHMTHHNTGDKWCIYPMYDFAHPIEDAIEGITHSLCTLEFEDHRPLYNWVVTELEYPHPPKQIEFAKMYLTNVVTGKRYIKKLVEDGIVDGWDDPRLVSIAALRRRGFTPESIKQFVKLSGISKSNASSDYAMLEYCIREDLKLKKPRVLAVLDPVKLIIDNYPEDKSEMLEIDNNLENESLGKRMVPFGRELYIEREDFMEEPPKKYFRMFPGNEVRLMNAYFVKCTGCVKDENGNVIEIHATYDPASKGGNSPDGRKVKGTIHWAPAKEAIKAEVRLYENIIDEEKGVYNEDGSLNLNPNSLIVLKNCYLEPSLINAKSGDSFQFVRQGYFCVDSKDSKEGALVFNRIVSLKSSYKLPK